MLQVDLVFGCFRMFSLQPLRAAPALKATDEKATIRKSPAEEKVEFPMDIWHGETIYIYYIYIYIVCVLTHGNDMGSIFFVYFGMSQGMFFF